MKRDFSEWMKGFKESIADYKYYVDFEKVYGNVKKIKIELNILNSLIGEKNIEEKFEEIIKEYPKTLNCIPILLAVRQMEIRIVAGRDLKFNFKKQNYSIEEYKTFMRETGLFDLLSSHLINNLVDYVTGVETGLDSNGRKNRGGKAAENIVESYLKESGCQYYKEMSASEIKRKFGIDTSKLSEDKKAEKRFDFVVKTNSQVYGIEVNFYNSSGSKLNETARSYKMLNKESQMIDGFTFVWITDGEGWYDAKSNLKETFNEMEHIYSIKDLEEGIFKRFFCGN